MYRILLILKGEGYTFVLNNVDGEVHFPTHVAAEKFIRDELPTFREGDIVSCILVQKIEEDTIKLPVYVERKVTRDMEPDNKWFVVGANHVILDTYDTEEEANTARDYLNGAKPKLPPFGGHLGPYNYQG